MINRKIPIRYCPECDKERWDRNTLKPVAEFKNVYKCLVCFNVVKGK